jgi:hypothetical protein
MYGISENQRMQGLDGLKTVLELGLYKSDLRVADLCVAGSVALGIRDVSGVARSSSANSICSI